MTQMSSSYIVKIDAMYSAFLSQCVPDGQSALMPAAARLKHIAGTRWGTKRYISMACLDEMKVEAL